MDNDPKSYRVPILHLTDVLPVEEVPAAAPAPVAPTPASTPVTPAPVTPPPLIDEAQMLHQAFIAKTQAELKKKAETAPVKKTTPTPKKKSKTVLRTPQVPKPLPVPTPVPIKSAEEEYVVKEPDEITETEPNENSGEETNEYFEEAADDVPEETAEYVEEQPVETAEETPSETVEEVPAEHVEPKPDAFIEKKGLGESLLEKFVTVAAERLDPLPDHKMRDYTGEEISQLFDNYLRENPLEPKPEEKVEEKVVEDVSMATFLPDPLDIWEQDAAKPKKGGFQNTSKPVIDTVPKKEEGLLETTFVPKDFVPASLNSSSNDATAPEIQTDWEDEMKKTLQRVPYTPKVDVSQKTDPVEVPIETKETTVKEDSKEPEVKTIQRGTLTPEDFTPQQSSVPRASDAPLQRIAYTPKDIKPIKPGLPKARFPEREQAKDEPEEAVEVKTVQRGTLTPEDFTPQQSSSVPHEEEGVTKVEISNNSNLSALRERIVKEHGGESAKPLGSESLDTEHATLNNTISQKIEALDTLTPAEPVSEERPRPQSKHAQILSNVAERLRQMSVESSEKHIDIQNVVEAQINESGKETEKKQGPLAPGEIRDPEPVPPPSTSVSSIRTFRQDVEQAVIKNKTSIVNMISAEENHRATDATIRTVPRRASSTLSYVFIGASIVLVAGALAIGAFVLVGYVFSDKPENTSVISLINKTVPYVITDQSKDEIMSGLVNLRDNTHNSLGSIIEIELYERVIGSVAGSDNILTSRAEPSVFLEKIATNAPGGLARSATETLILGIHEMTTNQAFLLFKVDHRDTAFRGMFEWEENMDKDLAPLFGPAVERKMVPQQQQPVVTDASSTVDQYVEQPAVEYEKVVYEDLFIFNKEVRGLRNEKGVLVLLWAMPDDSTVLITSNEVTMRTILEQLATQSSYSN